MEIRLMPRVEDIDSTLVQGSSVIVIDILRATSVIVTAMNNGAKSVVPVLTVEKAFEKKDKYDDSVLGGERKGLKIEGFNAGNSPLEYSRGFIDGKTLIITTSNGTRAIKGSYGAKNIYIGSMLNGRSAAKEAFNSKNDVSIICAGTLGKFSLDDFMCAGHIIDELLKFGGYDMDDVSFLAYHTFEENKYNVLEFIKNARHACYLESIGMSKDIEYCCSMDIIEIVPEYRDGEIKSN